MRPSPSRSFRYGVAVLIVATVLPLIFIPVVGRGLTSLVLVGILLSAWYGGLGPGLLTTALMSAGIVAALVASRFPFQPWLAISQALFLAEGTLATLLVEALHRARRRAEAASLAKDRFLAALSHELRTPLTPALATVSALLNDPATPDAVRPELETARRNIELEARLIDDLLDLTRIGRGALTLAREATDVHALIRRAATVCAADLEAAGAGLPHYVL